jgi:hypothetical protein
MAKQFDPRKVLKQVSNPLLRQFFARRDQLLALNWGALAETDVQPVFDAWHALPEPERREVQVTLQDVNELADDRGLRVLAEEVAWREPGRMAEFVAVEGRCDKAMWVYLNVPAAFTEAARFAWADAASAGRYWHKRNGLPRSDKPLAVTDATRQSLAAALVEFYPEAEGRGHWCHVEHYRRANGSEYFFAYLDDYPDTKVVFGELGEMCRQRERGAFDNVFVYCPADGTLETYAHGGRKVREPLEGLFADAVLGAAVGPEPPAAAAYALNGLLDAGLALPTDPADGVTEVRVRKLRLEVAAAPGERVTLEAGPRAHPQQVYRMMERYLNAATLPASALRVVGATFMLTFAPVGGAKARTLTFDVGHPSSCDLKSKSDEMRAVGERSLKLRRVSRA